ncbi:replication initiator [Dermatophilaceae bacterium Soc4.6]
MLRSQADARGRLGEGFDVGSDAARVAAESAGVCVRPHVKTVTDVTTGATTAVPIPCGSTREAVCAPCATKAKRLRMHQCREGWHRATDPDLADDNPDGADEADEPAADKEQLEDGADDEAPGAAGARRVRSTRRLDGFPDLPTITMNQRTTGRTFTDEATGKHYQPSMFVTLTLPSYGRIIPGTGVPADPTSYDYRRAALDAILWPRLLDRFWQNLRRCAGYKVQYFSAIEAQRRLAPHLHAAVRGTIPRATIKAVTRATYHAAWWPALDTIAYPVLGGPGTDAVPLWVPELEAYVDPDTLTPLPTWEQACDEVEDPAHVVRFGSQVDIKGLLGGTPDSDRTVRYLCKYLTKNIADTYIGQHPADHADGDDTGESGRGGWVAAAYERHIDRLHAEVQLLPCGPACGNWLRYGVQPAEAGPGLAPGRCQSPTHDRENLGLGGRRVLVSRQWSGKTLTEHRADRRAVVTAVLTAAGIDPGDADQMAADRTLLDGSPRYVWGDVEPGDVDYVAVIAASLRQANRWRQQYEEAKAAAEGRASPAAVPLAG